MRSTAHRSLRQGRARATSRGQLSHLALELFLERGFENTTVDDIVEAAGIGRRTFFRYFPSKNDLPWGEFELLLDGFRDHLARLDPELPLAETLRLATIEFNRFPEAEIPYHRERMRLLLKVPSLVAHATLKYAAWREVIAEYVAGRLGQPVTGITAQTIAWTCLGICISAYEQWLTEENSDLGQLLEAAFSVVDDTFCTPTAEIEG